MRTVTVLLGILASAGVGCSSPWDDLLLGYSVTHDDRCEAAVCGPRWDLIDVAVRDQSTGLLLPEPTVTVRPVGGLPQPCRCTATAGCACPAAGVGTFVVEVRAAGYHPAQLTVEVPTPPRNPEGCCERAPAPLGYQTVLLGVLAEPLP